MNTNKFHFDQLKWNFLELTQKYQAHIKKEILLDYYRVIRFKQYIINNILKEKNEIAFKFSIAIMKPYFLEFIEFPR
jgi:hypothetical protein